MMPNLFRLKQLIISKTKSLLLLMMKLIRVAMNRQKRLSRFKMLKKIPNLLPKSKLKLTKRKRRKKKRKKKTIHERKSMLYLNKTSRG